MRNPIENKSAGGKNPEQVREKIVEKVLKTLAKNIEYANDPKESQSLKERLLGADQNPLRLAQGKVLQDFNAVLVEGLMGIRTYEGSVFMKPYLSHKDEQQGKTRINVQPMSIHLDAIEKDKEGRIELAEQIWSGISLEEKVALALKYIDFEIEKRNLWLTDMPRIAKEADWSVSEVKSLTEEYKHDLKIFLELSVAIKKGTFSVEVDDNYASLIFSPKKEN